jgi:hypothetical protein
MPMSSSPAIAPRTRFIPLELQRLFSRLQAGVQEAYSTSDLTLRGFQWTAADGSVQHDAHELNRYIDICIYVYRYMYICLWLCI